MRLVVPDEKMTATLSGVVFTYFKAFHNLTSLYKEHYIIKDTKKKGCVGIE